MPEPFKQRKLLKYKISLIWTTVIKLLLIMKCKYYHFCYCFFRWYGAAINWNGTLPFFWAKRIMHKKDSFKFSNLHPQAAQKYYIFIATLSLWSWLIYTVSPSTFVLRQAVRSIKDTFGVQKLWLIGRTFTNYKGLGMGVQWVVCNLKENWKRVITQ